MIDRTPLTQERLKELLHYDPDTGDWHWKVRRSRTAPAGSSAGTMSEQLGRNDKSHSILRIKIDGRNYYAHRLAFLYMLGRWLRGEVDHKNRNPMDFCWTNLREGASRSQQAANKAKRDGWSSRHKGVYRHKRNKSWCAIIGVNRKQIYLGSYANEDEAGRAYNVAAIRYFGGEYAVLNDVPALLTSSTEEKKLPPPCISLQTRKLTPSQNPPAVQNHSNKNSKLDEFLSAVNF